MLRRGKPRCSRDRLTALSDAKCGCGRFTRTGYQNGECRLCWKWFIDPAFAKAWGPHPFGDPAYVPPKGVRLKPLPCVHIGEPLTMNAIQAAELDPRKSWHYCQVGQTKNKQGIVGVACVCEGCGPKCEGYKTASEV